MRVKIFGVALSLVLVICAVFFSVRFFLPQKDYDEIPLSQRKDSSEPLKNEQVKEEKIRYLLTLEGKNLCAYREESGEKLLIHSKAVEPMLMTKDDIEKLKNGIYAENHEDLWLYFESYMS